MLHEFSEHAIACQGRIIDSDDESISEEQYITYKNINSGEESYNSSSRLIRLVGHQKYIKCKDIESKLMRFRRITVVQRKQH
jgi:hypothetical protein